MTKYVSTQISGYILRRLDDIFSSRRQQSGYRVTSSTATSSSPAFTIVELLVVIVVIGILAAITIVSYSGITNRATISSLQSDLTNASTTLKLDYVSNGTYPTTLALANGGKGITQSQTLDNIIYIPDNTSNPNNFCLQYRKGNNTYAVDSTSAVSSGVCLQNLVTNGDFSNGATGWSYNGITDSVVGNARTIKATTANSEHYSDQTYNNPNAGDRYYIATYIGNVNDCQALIKSFNKKADGTYEETDSPQVLSSGLASLIFSPTSINSNPNMITRLYLRNIVGASVYAGTDQSATFSSVMGIDLTTSFGAGNEPTKSQMDTIMSSYPNSWFNIVAKANL